MANWDLLNKNYQDVVNNISDAEWKTWAINREKKKELRRFSLAIKEKSAELMLKLESLIENSIHTTAKVDPVFTEPDCYIVDFVYTDIISNTHVEAANENDFIIAA